MALHLWLTFITAYIVFTISPGPNVVLVIRNSLKYGSSSALLTICGNLTAQLIIIGLVACGVGAAIAALPGFFLVMKVAGAAYLILVGARQIIGTYKNGGENTAAAPPGMAAMSKSGVYREAFLVSISNPKTLIFVSAFLPQFVDQHSTLPAQFAVMYVTMSAVIATVHIFYSFFINRLKHKFTGRRTVNTIKYLGGSFFVLMGLKLLTSEQN